MTDKTKEKKGSEQKQADESMEVRPKPTLMEQVGKMNEAELRNAVLKLVHQVDEKDRLLNNPNERKAQRYVLKGHSSKSTESIEMMVKLLKEKKSVVKIGEYVSYALATRNPCLAKKISCRVKQSISEETIKLISTALVQLSDIEIGFALAKSGEADNAEETKELEVDEINKYVRTEKEYYDVFTNHMKLYCPNLRSIDKSFIFDVMHSRKFLFELKEINYINPPKVEEFTIEGNSRYWIEPEVAKYLPSNCTDREYMFTILNTVHKGIVDSAVETSNIARTNENIKKKGVINASASFATKFTTAMKKVFTRSSARRSVTKRLSETNMTKEPKERVRKHHDIIKVTKLDGSVEAEFISKRKKLELEESGK